MYVCACIYTVVRMHVYTYLYVYIRICMCTSPVPIVCTYVYTYNSVICSLLLTSRHLGGKFGQQLTNELGVTHMGQLRRFSKVELQRKLGAKQGYE